MAWSTRSKDMSVGPPTTAHPNTTVGVVGRMPGISTISFTPSDLFGAMARCLHLHTISPLLASPEARIASSLLEQHVDDTNPDFFILATADRFKDYAKSYFSGTVAAGIAYLVMIQDGYVWADHFENQVAFGPGVGNAAAARAPDFVFGRPSDSDVALMESKGTRSANWPAFDRPVRNGYIDQVEPHLGFNVGGALATHGYSIGACLMSSTKADLGIHYTSVPVLAASPPSQSSISGLQLGNYVTAFRLAHSEGLASQLRSGIIPGDIAFFQIRWLDRFWLTWVPGSDVGSQAGFFSMSLTKGMSAVWNDMFFAIERSVAERIFSILSENEGLPGSGFGLEPMEPGLETSAREDGGSVFPDGLAIIRASHLNTPTRVNWSSQNRAFVSA